MICVSRRRLRQGAFLAEFNPPVVKLGPHVAPLGMKLYYRVSIPGRLLGETGKDEKMTPVAADLTDDDIRGLGAYFASLPGPAPTEADPDPALTKAAAALV